MHTSPAEPSLDEAHRLIQSFDLEAAAARRPYMRVAAAGYWFDEEDKISFGLNRAGEINTKTRT
jgi:hypothetical protein